MANLIDYIHKYGHVSFSRKKFNDIDNLIFSNLAYIDFNNTMAVKNGHKLGEICEEYIKKNRFRDVSKQGLGRRDAYKIIMELKDAPRFANVTVNDFVYIMDEDTQFGAVTFRLTRYLSYVAFEGTDQSMGGWKEDCLLACSYPVDSHKLGASYLRKQLRVSGPRVIVGGHSKGGNTALAAAIEMRGWRQRKIRAVYNNDGPGLRRREMESEAFRALRPKYKLIVPHNSIVGMMLRQAEPFVVKSDQRGVFAHQMISWQVMDDKLRRSVLSARSQALNKAIISWLDKHNDSERLGMVNDVFELFDASGIDSTLDLRNFKKIIRLVKNFKDIDKETRELGLSLVKYSYDNVISAKKKAMI